MNTLTSLSPSALRKAADIQERILALQDQLNEILGATFPAPAATVAVGQPASAVKRTGRKRKLSPEGLANIRAGVAKRMARMGAKPPGSNGKPKRRISPALRKARSDAMKARWAARKAAGQSQL